ncbi:Nucleolar protein 16 [Entomophthora muscae]|uniref:Nucleolar protein 16 n=1 Tax=Entomophthora muscae TaxID=34485 RepID=A0ACC2US40_9FUNG|nr:Nucleolar protein 16 [Entomophthora muscae]
MVNPTQRRKVKNPTHKGRKFRTPRKPTVPNLPGLKEKWNMKISVKSNYEKLGLMSTVNKVKGAFCAEVTADSRVGPDTTNLEGMSTEELSRHLGSNYGVIERDPEGNILRVVIADKDAILDNKPLPTPAKTDFVRGLEELAKQTSAPTLLMSEFDKSYIEALYKKYGNQYKLMARDIKLNYNQLTTSQLQKKCEKYQKCFGASS